MARLIWRKDLLLRTIRIAMKRVKLFRPIRLDSPRAPSITLLVRGRAAFDGAADCWPGFRVALEPAPTRADESRRMNWMDAHRPRSDGRGSEVCSWSASG